MIVRLKEFGDDSDDTFEDGFNSMIVRLKELLWLRQTIDSVQVSIL